MNKSIVLRILELDAERKSLIYDFDKILPANRQKYEEIQHELAWIERVWASEFKNDE